MSGFPCNDAIVRNRAVAFSKCGLRRLQVVLTERGEKVLALFPTEQLTII